MGGIVQGIGAALMEEYRYGDATATLQTRDVPGVPAARACTRSPEIVIEHLETPSPFTELRREGRRRGGRLVAPTAIASAVDDALRAPRRVRRRAAHDARARGRRWSPTPGGRAERCQRGRPGTRPPRPPAAPEEILAAAGAAHDGRGLSLAVPRFTGHAAVRRAPAVPVLSMRAPRRAAGRPASARGVRRQRRLLRATSPSSLMARRRTAARTSTRCPLDRSATTTTGTAAEPARPTSATSARCGATRRAPAASSPRGVLLDVPGPPRRRRAAAARRSTPTSWRRDRGGHQGVAAGAGDVALFRTGYLALLARRRAPRPATPPRARTSRAARLLARPRRRGRGLRTPRPSRSSHAPDHGDPPTRSPCTACCSSSAASTSWRAIDLEELAGGRGVREFLFVALPLEIRGATGSMLDPVAIV